MKATQLAIATAVVTCLTAWSGYALATQPGNNGGGNGGCGVGQQTNGCGSPVGSATGGSATASAGAVGVGVGIGYGQGGAGGSANVLGSGNSSVKNDNSNVGVNLQGQQQGQGQHQSATGGASNQSQSSSATGTNSGSNIGQGNSTNVNFEGSTYKEAAQTAYAPTPTGPRNSCRIFVGLGGSSVNGSLSGGIPLSNDQTCISGAQVEFMQTVNKIKPNTFTVEDYLLAVCSVEGMDRMAACKK